MTAASITTIPIDNPFLEHLGITLTEWSPGYAEMHLDTSHDLSNRTGRIHGGVICTLLDSVCGYCGLYSPPGEPVLRSLTLSLTSNFISSGDGSTLVAKGFLVRKGRSVFFARAEVWLDDVELLATAVGTFKYVRA
jgi:uncharacterized protein (TIGR00369 family)